MLSTWLYVIEWLTGWLCTEIRSVDIHYELQLPFRSDEIHLPNNYEQAVRRVGSQFKMLRDPRDHHDYVTFMNNFLTRNYAELVPPWGTQCSRSWRMVPIPHHGIYHPNNCSPTYRGISLNSLLLQGPADLTNSLLGVLARFREEPIAFVGEIESMFYQVKVPVQQRTFPRFVWFPDGDLHKPLTEYWITVYLFGAVSSLNICNYSYQCLWDRLVWIVKGNLAPLSWTQFARTSMWRAVWSPFKMRESPWDCSRTYNMLVQVVDFRWQSSWVTVVKFWNMPFACKIHFPITCLEGYRWPSRRL